jgi:cupin superfamily acireductone dioxygenase involved in methionine salvage
MNKTTCPNGMVDTCCENYDHCTLSYHDKDAEIKRLNEKIEFLARTNMLYSDWEHRETQVTSELIRKGIEEHKINAELRAEIERLKQRTWVGLTKEEIAEFDTWHDHREEEVGWCNPSEIVAYIEAKLRSKNNV